MCAVLVEKYGLLDFTLANHLPHGFYDIYHKQLNKVNGRSVSTINSLKTFKTVTTNKSIPIFDLLGRKVRSKENIKSGELLFLTKDKFSRGYIHLYSD